jgi:hypothetical protein
MLEGDTHPHTDIKGATEREREREPERAGESWRELQKGKQIFSIAEVSHGNEGDLSSNVH